jgi:hypothetical protein
MFKARIHVVEDVFREEMRVTIDSYRHHGLLFGNLIVDPVSVAVEAAIMISLGDRRKPVGREPPRFSSVRAHEGLGEV